MQLFEYANWIGLIFWIISGCSLALFQIRKIIKEGLIRSLASEVSNHEKNILKVSGFFFGAGILSFILGIALS
ncbi:hypothetical protein G3N55_12175 [Dissulfurirhabdus thermomarina]|uniref:Uncharacterized protein n=1 Tax=Dissulfurirhabdus thermomarina TaxID=1765737 RepID=A0A6N9TQP1_DISTH|nr:hypothetical protein [Dissulfurirhabdus thermomarina]NDY43591.1 hypothetical protein [Dissulfurirhabdus thermomarina]